MSATESAAEFLDGGAYPDVVERARAGAARKRLSGEIPAGTGAALDRLFLEVAPAGARPGGEGLTALVETLARYRFDPSVAVGAGPGLRGRVTHLVKRGLQPLAVWQLRHLTDQLNAYHQAEAEVLRGIAEALERRATHDSPDP